MSIQTATISSIVASQQNDLIDKLKEASIPHSVLSLIPYDIAIEYSVLPFVVDEQGRLEAAIDFENDIDRLQKIQTVLGRSVKPHNVQRDAVMTLIGKHYGTQIRAKEQGERAESKNRRLVVNISDSTITIVNDIIHEALRLRASDIHLEPFEREMAVRFRIDGVLHEMASIPVDRILETVSRIKILAKMDIAEKRRAQDGRIRIEGQGRDVDIRVSTLPTDFGEKTVLRLLDKNAFDYRLESLGMDPTRLAMFKRAIEQPNGIVLLTGPTGSGKSTTLYAAINYIKQPSINISTVEDPIEYNIPGVNQTQVSQATGMTFANSLRTLLRQDPDVIMVGEMRDRETAEIAIRSSLTGHLVLSTLHTNDAASAATRLVDMGVEPYLVSSSLTMIIAQRLVRKICDHCKCETIVSEDIRKTFGLQKDLVLYKGLGCSACGYTGYRGRTGLYEVLPISDNLRALINNKTYASEIRNAAIKEGLVLLRDHALSRLTDGITSAEEVFREVSVIS
ncbi:MAG: GspE/PulE family protein [Chitinispirillaceae bacterium]|jgi:type IV pilus assembly protein PilB